MADLSIIIVNWNSRGFLRKCIASIERSVRTLDYEIIVVDSASFDGCDEMLRTNYPWVRFIQSATNVGFGSANNIGAASARGQELLFLNPDTEVVGDAIDRLYARIRELPAAGVLGCRLTNGDGTLQSSCVQRFPTVLNQLLDLALLQRTFPRWWLSASTYERASSPVAVEVICGACMMIARSLFLKVGGFSPDYFMYGEDVDLCHKTREAGHVNYYEPSCGIVHHGGGSTKNRHSRFSEVMTRDSVSRFLRKSRGAAYGAAYRGALLGSAVLRLGVLALLLLPALAARKGQTWLVAVNKWWSILRWGLGLEKWVFRFYGKAELSADGDRRDGCHNSVLGSSAGSGDA